MMNNQDYVQILQSMKPPFVHYCLKVDGDYVSQDLGKKLLNYEIITLDGNTFRTEDSFTKVCNEKFGLALDFQPNDSELFWMRFSDLVSTDIKFQGSVGCVIIVSDAENAFKSTADGLIRFGNAMNHAGMQYANPDKLGLSSGYAPKSRSVHTLLCYQNMPQRVPNANLIKF